jgi:hypothetical protein
MGHWPTMAMMMDPCAFVRHHAKIDPGCVALMLLQLMKKILILAPMSLNSIATNTTDDGGGYHTAVVDSNSCHDMLLLSSTTHVPRLVGHKRVRSSRGAGQQQKGPSSSPSSKSPTIQTVNVVAFMKMLCPIFCGLISIWTIR